MNKTANAVSEIKKVIQGKDEIIKKVISALLCGGHVLLEDVPGVGKTTLAITISRVLALKYKRIQFTPDVMPGDVVGFSMYNKKTENFEYVPGAVNCNILLADEINRTSPKTQSALLEVMEEGKVTVDSVTRELPKPFIVIATQNPFGSTGTQRLPLSQMDRFTVRLSMGYPERESEIAILKGKGMSNIDSVEQIVTEDELKTMQKECASMYVSDEIYGLIADISSLTRQSEYFEMGISPRGSIAVLKMARANAYIEGRDFVIPEDINEVLPATVSHRILLSERAYAEGMSEKEALAAALEGNKKIILP